MLATVNLYSEKHGEINRFLSNYYNTNLQLENRKRWEKKYNNPIEITEIIGTFIDNSDNYSINMWISIDKGIFITITNENADDIIKYLYERFPY